MNGLRLGVYTDYAYEIVDGEVYAERAFALFLARLRGEFDSLQVIGRAKPAGGGGARYPLGSDVSLLALPFYASLARPWSALPALARSLSTFWRGMDDLDAVWLLGPHPLAIAFALMAKARRKKVVLGVRQDLPTYTSMRHPGRRGMVAAAWLLELTFRAMARRVPVVAVGPDLAANYRRSPKTLEIVVSLVPLESVASPAEASGKDYDGQLTILTVGRLDSEKNPLLQVDVMDEIERTQPGRWRLDICGEGPAEGPIAARVSELGLEDKVTLRGYVQWGVELDARYRSSHVLLHISRTEGFPQVLIEAMAAGLPIVATNVGGIAEAIGEAAAMVPPNDVQAVVEALGRLAGDPSQRQAAQGAGLEFARSHTIEAETAKVAALIAGL